MKKIKYTLKKKLKDTGFPTNPRDKYLVAHEEASKAEKKEFGAKQYNKLKKMDEDFPNHELLGKNLKSGKIEVSKKVPKKLRQEVAFHETVENDHLLKRRKKLKAFLITQKKALKKKAKKTVSKFITRGKKAIQATTVKAKGIVSTLKSFVVKKKKSKKR